MDCTTACLKAAPTQTDNKEEFKQCKIKDPVIGRVYFKRQEGREPRGELEGLKLETIS